MKMSWFVLTNILATVLLMAPSTAQAQEVKVNAVATFSILGDIVRQVGGTQVNLTVLVGPDGDAHTFEPTPQDSIRLSQAAVIFENGFYFEHWLNGLYASSASKARRVVVTDTIKPIALATKDIDPHAWQDVSNVMLMTKQVRDGLIAVDPANAATYRANADAYLAQLNELEEWIMNIFKDIPADKRRLVTSHDALGYFAHHYGLTIIGTAIPSATTEADEPSARETAKLLDVIRSSGVKVVFAENTHNAKLIETLSKEAGVILAPALYTDALGKPGSDGDTYIKMMQHNVKIFAEYLK